MGSVHKGKAKEREAAQYLRSLGFPLAERNARNGKAASDLVVPELSNLCIEVKADKKIGVGTKALLDALTQADGYGKERGVVLWWEVRQDWRLTWLHDTGAFLVPATTSGDFYIKAILNKLNEEVGNGK